MSARSLRLGAFASPIAQTVDLSNLAFSYSDSVVSANSVVNFFCSTPNEASSKIRAQNSYRRFFTFDSQLSTVDFPPLPPESSPSFPNPHAPTGDSDTDTSPPHSDREIPSSTARAAKPDSYLPNKARSPHPAKTAHSPATQKIPSTQNAPDEYETHATPGCDSPKSNPPHRPDA
jgi:hypothetical protein